MSVLSDQAVPRGDIMRRLAELEEQVRQLRTARRLEAASIGSGGVRIHSGGSVRVEADGNIIAEGGEITSFGPDGRLASLDQGWLILRSTDRIPESLGYIGAGLVEFEGDDHAFTEIVAPKVEGSQSQPSVFLGENGIQIQGSGPVSDGAFFAVTGGTMAIYSRETFILMQDQAGGVLVDLGPSGETELGVRTSYVTTSAAANTHIFPASGRIAISTSSARFKSSIEDLNIDPEAVLRLRPRTWRDRAEEDADPQSERWYVGLIAEEVDEAGLTEFVEYDAAGRPWAVAYDRLAVALLAVIRQQQERLDALDGGASTARAPGRRKPPRLPVPDPAGAPPTPSAAQRGGSRVRAASARRSHTP